MSPWPFEDPKDHTVYTTRFVLEEDRPILLVSRDPDGEWEFLCTMTDDPKDAREVSLAFIVDQDPRVAEVADLPVAWRAFRDSPESPWLQRPFSPGELALFGES
ncbi:MAG TPA: hypothetical protein VFL41_13165 [Gaiellaceae bacterium]|nr:hypothetical protein [Gaiellaceae bacterium]